MVSPGLSGHAARDVSHRSPTPADSAANAAPPGLWPVAPAELGRALARYGFDLTAVGPWSVLSEASRASVAAGVRVDPDRAELLITGNTRALWPHFVAHAAGAQAREPGPSSAAELQPAHPLDAYTERVHRGLAPQGCVLQFAHQIAPALPFQRLGAELQLCEAGPAGLSVHPEYGPWFALRALYIFPHGTTSALLGTRRSGAQPSRSRCAGCSAPCKPALTTALRVTKTLDREGVASAFAAWLAVRDACPAGREHRYDSEQIRFHYGVDAAPGACEDEPHAAQA